METTGQQILLAARSDKLRTYSIPGGNNTPSTTYAFNRTGCRQLGTTFSHAKGTAAHEFRGDEKRLIARILGHIFCRGYNNLRLLKNGILNAYILRFSKSVSFFAGLWVLIPVV